MTLGTKVYDKHEQFGIARDDPDLERFRSFSRTLHQRQRSTCLFQGLEHAGHRLIESDGWLGEGRHGVTVEIGVGGGQHLSFVRQREDYYGFELDGEHLRSLRTERDLPVTCGDILALPLATSSVARVVAASVLEHLYPLEPYLDEVSRVMKSGAVFDVVLPPEGGFLYSVVYRRLVTVPQLRRWGIRDPLRLLRFNHCNSVPQILEALRQRFDIVRRIAWPINALGLHLAVVVAVRARRL